MTGIDKLTLSSNNVRGMTCDSENKDWGLELCLRK